MQKAVALVCAVLSAPALSAQVAGPLRFEVVSVRPNTSVGQGGMMSNLTGTQFTASNIRLDLIILSAFDVRAVQLVGAPDWIRSERFDIAAKFPEGAYSLAQRRSMVQQMLADRFGLAARRERQEVPIYRLVMAREDRRLGQNLKASAVDCEQWFAEKRSQIIGTPPIGPGGARPACLMVGNSGYVLGGTRSMAQLARSLESSVSRPVVDATELPGNFDIDLQWTPDPGPDGVSIFTAIQEQLGLKLEPATGPVDVVVVESIRRPDAQ